MVWSAANLDPEAFDHPLEVDFDRERNPHVAFASGFHRCLGSHLARLELRTAIGRFHERIPKYRLAAGTTPEYHNQGVRSVNPLVLDFDRSFR